MTEGILDAMHPGTMGFGMVLRVINVALAGTAVALMAACVMVYLREPALHWRIIALAQLPAVVASVLGTLRLQSLSVPAGWGVPLITAWLVLLNLGLVAAWRYEPVRRRIPSRSTPTPQE